VQRRMAEKRLFRLPSRFLGEETPRTMVVSPDILQVVTPPHSDDPVREQRLSEFRQTLDAFSD
jgi:hypothetical protein